MNITSYEKIRIGYLSLGSNLGDRRENLRAAIEALNAHPDIQVKAVSQVYETAPMGVTEQPDFFNIAAYIETTLAAHELLKIAKDIERQMGRVKGQRWGPRVIDIDLLLLDDEVIQTEDLTMPHPSMVERAFVMIPLAEIAPDVMLQGERAEEIAARLSKEQRVNAKFSL